MNEFLILLKYAIRMKKEMQTKVIRSGKAGKGFIPLFRAPKYTDKITNADNHFEKN